MANILRWPVIVGIVILSLTILSVIFCIVRCVCCGAQCCCGCLSCLSCCCPSRRRKAPKQSLAYPPNPYAAVPYHQQFPASYTGPQTAQFNTSPKAYMAVDEDALPAMPTWETSAQKRVKNTVSSYQTADTEMKGIIPSSPATWTPNNDTLVTGYGQPRGLSQSGTANEFYTSQNTGYLESDIGAQVAYSARRAFPSYNNSPTSFNGTPYKSDLDDTRYEPFRSVGYSDTQGNHHSGMGDGFYEQQNGPNDYLSRRPAQGVWRDI